VPIIFITNKTNELWESESKKRNTQIDMIGKLFPKDRAYIFVKDGDEFFQQNSGRVHLWLKPLLDEAYPDVGMCRAYAYDSNKDGKTPRMIPLNHGIHYYTEKSMCIHTKNHNLLIDYNHIDEPYVQPSDNMKVFHIDDFFLVNKWNIRTAERLQEKHYFDQYRDTQDNNVGECKYVN